MEQLAVKGQPQSLMSAINDNETRSLARRFDSETYIANKRSDVVEVSVFDGDAPASIDDIRKEVAMLRSVWKDLQGDFWGTLALVIGESGMSRERLHFAVTQFLLSHTYGKSFTPAELISIDKKIIVARTVNGLRSKVRYQLEWEDIVMVEMFNERRYALAEDAKMYKLNILAKLHSPYGTHEWVGTYKSEAFIERVKKFADDIKKHVGEYPLEMCREFYEYWAKPMQCGDVMLKELQWSTQRINSDGSHDDLLAEYLDEWAVSHGYESVNQPITRNESES
jgi:hypothetical protein